MWPAAQAKPPKFELAFAKGLRVAGIACSPWKPGAEACDVVFVSKQTGVLSCMVLAVNPRTLAIVGGQAVKCPASVTSRSGPKA